MMLRSLVAIALVLAARCAFAAAADDLLAAARQALERGDTDQALSLATKAVNSEPKDPACYVARAGVFDARREFDKAVGDYGRAIELSPTAAGAYQRRGEDQFRLGRFKESVADFDRAVALEPAREPYNWQRGISLYYAGEFARGATQFELHKTVNPDDVENAVWHYLCVARDAGVDKARQGLIPIRGDTRVPMMQVHALFAGKATANDVLAAAQAGNPREAELKLRLFYAHLYIGLWHEAARDEDAAREHIRLAAEKYGEDGYMGDVARVHAKKGVAGRE